MKIHITGNFYIYAKKKEFILKEEYEGKTKSGQPRKGERFVGSYNSISTAVHRCLELSVLNGAQAVELWKYAKLVEESNKAAAQAIQKEIAMILKERELGINEDRMICKKCGKVKIVER